MDTSYGFLRKNAHIIVITLLALQLFLLIPAEIYLTNISEMTVGLIDIAKICLVPALFCLFACLLVYRVSSTKVRQYWLIFLMGFMLLSWLQSHVILWDYGLLDGRSIDWTQKMWRGSIDLVIWCAGFAVLFKWAKNRIPLLTGVCITVFVMQLSSVVLAVVQQRTNLSPASNFNDQQHLQKIHDFSKDRNVIHIIVDGFQADVFDDLINNKMLGADYRKTFSGFTYYKENLGIFPYTRFAVPGFLGADVYNNKQTKDGFVDQVLGGNNILNLAKQQGYDLDIASGSGYFIQKYALTKHDHIYNLDNDIAINPVLKESASLIDLAMFRFLPHYAKPLIYRNQNWLISDLLYGKRNLNHQYFKHTRFLHSLIANIRLNRERPVYKYIHVMTAHNPMVVDSRCEYAGSTSFMKRETLTYQSKCSMDTLSVLLQRFKEVGIYDSSLIVIQGDHGGWVGNFRDGPKIRFGGGKQGEDWIKSLASPLLAIKKPGAQGELVTSSQHTSLLQLPNTIADIMAWEQGFDYPSVLAPSAEQPDTRNFYFYYWQRDAWETDYTGPIVKFDIKGSHYEAEWKSSEVFFPPL